MTGNDRAAIGLCFIATWLLPGSVAARLAFVVHASGFSQPVAFAQDPSDLTVQYVVEQAGTIRVIKNRVVQGTPFLDLRASVVAGGEQGLLGIAFPPDYESTGRFYVNFTRAGDGYTVVARFKRSANPLVADPASRFDLVWSTGNSFIFQPFANHNGGCLSFGPDGYLYIGTGDGGSANDPDHRAQNTSELLGKILRVDVGVPDTHPQGFVIPAGNPAFPRPEIWSLGLRNPWKFSFDGPARGGTGAMIIGDVGQGSWEEVDYTPAGAAGRNYGWRNREGAHNNVTSLPPGTLPLIDPIFEYDHATGHSISGGYLYRGATMPTMRGRYFFADYVDRRVWSIRIVVDPGTGEATAADLLEHTAELGGQGALGNISGFGLDSAGELYIISYSAGAILRVVQVPPAPQGLRVPR